LVSYNVKHNEANGEANRDGNDDNRSWNCGVEGPADDPDVLALRLQQRRNLLATLLLSEGVPLLLGGDELGRTQRGNNNAYCQDNEISWVDWSLAGCPEDLSEFVAALCHLRLNTPVLRRSRFFREEEIVWLRPDGHTMTAADWNMPSARAMTIAAPAGEHVLLINGCAEPVTFRLPDVVQNARMAVLLDTSDGHAPGSAVQGDVPLAGRSLMMLERSCPESLSGTSGWHGRQPVAAAAPDMAAAWQRRLPECDPTVALHKGRRDRDANLDEDGRAPGGDRLWFCDDRAGSRG
jgi:isoamylase